MRRPPPRDQPPTRRFRRDLPRPEGPFDRLLRRRPERDPAPIIIGGTIAFLAIVILLVVGVSTLLGGGSGGATSNTNEGDVDFGGVSGRLTSRLPGLPPGLQQVSDYVEFNLDKDAPPISGFALPLREKIDDPAGLGFYTFGERWQRLTDVKVIRNGRAEGEFASIPPNLVVLRVATQPYQIVGSLPPGGTLHSEAQVTIVSPRDYAPAQDGSVQGTATAVPPERNYLVVPTIVGSGEDTAKAVNEILANGDRRKTHIDAIVALVNNSKLDGIDLEYSSVDVDLEGEFTEFVSTLADRLGDKRLSLTLPPPTNQRQAYDWQAIGKTADFIKILPIADPVSYWETMPRAISQVVEDVDPSKVMLVVSPYSIEGVGDVTRPIGYLQAMVLAAEAAVREPAKPEDIKPGVTVKLVAKNLDPAEGASPLRWDQDAVAVRFDLGGTERRRIVIENSFSVGFKLEIVQAYRLSGLAVSDASAQSDVANLWPSIKELMHSGTVSIKRPNESSLLPVWQAPEGGDFGAGAGTTATWTAPKEGPHNIVLVVSDGERRFGRNTLIDVRKGNPASPTPLITFAPPTPVPTPTPSPTTPTPPPPPPTLPMEMGVRADGSDDNSTATNDEHTAPGSTVKYYVIIDNDSPVKVTVTALVDSLRGNISDCKTAGGAASAVGIELDPDDGDGPGDVDPDGADAVSCTFEFTAPSTPNTELKLAVAARVTAGDGQQGADFDDNTKVTTTS
jgi:hypothetical protein